MDDKDQKHDYIGYRQRPTIKQKALNNTKSLPAINISASEEEEECNIDHDEFETAYKVPNKYNKHRDLSRM